jgi:hypothetical protein
VPSFPIRIGFVLVVLAIIGALTLRRLIPGPPVIPPLPSTILTGSRHSAEIRGVCRDIYSAVCRAGRKSWDDPTGAVDPDAEGERQASLLYTEIVNSSPGWSEWRAQAELARRIYTPERVKRVLEAYRWVERAIESLIESQPRSVFTWREKAALRGRLRATRLELPPPASVYVDRPELFLRTDVIYERALDGRTRLRIGGAYLLATQSWFNLVFTLAHELAHAIDPCEIRAAGLAMPAYDRLSGCFLGQGLIEARSTRSVCGKYDQLAETFADWMAVQVTGEALTRFRDEFKESSVASAAANSVRDLCDEDEDYEPDSQFHPEPKIRIERIFGQNPRIRGLLGCPDLPASVEGYCGFETAPAAHTAPGPERQ